MRYTKTVQNLYVKQQINVHVPKVGGCVNSNSHALLTLYNSRYCEILVFITVS